MSSTLAKRGNATVTKFLFAWRFSGEFAVRFDLLRASGNIGNKLVKHSKTLVGVFGSEDFDVNIAKLRNQAVFIGGLGIFVVFVFGSFLDDIVGGELERSESVGEVKLGQKS